MIVGSATLIDTSLRDVLHVLIKLRLARITALDNVRGDRRLDERRAKPLLSLERTT